MRARRNRRDSAGAIGTICAICAICALWVLLGACSHDLEALRAGQSTGGAGTAGGGVGSGGAGGAAGSAASAGGGEDLDACAPCGEPSREAAALGFAACCRGVRSAACGLRLNDGVCLPRDLPGELDAACPSVTALEQSLAGCCRPDTRCGVDLAVLGLGCVPREELPDVVGDGLEPIECALACEQDDDCAELSSEGSVCVPDVDNRTIRFCAARCSRDRDCSSGHVCGLANDIDRDRLVSYCQPPIGELQPGARCSVADDCERGVCIRLPGSDQGLCSRLCETDPDCSGVLGNCVQSTIPRPESGDPQTFDVCSQ